MARSEDDLFTIGQVVEEFSGEFPDVTHSSLRFLEREGLVVPLRTTGGHRMYRPQDVDRIRQIKAWQLQRLSLKEIEQRLQAADALPASSELAGQFLELAIAGEYERARQVVFEADRLGQSPAATFGAVLKPALYEVGDRWESGQLSVGQEKEISALTRDVIAELTLRHERLDDPRGRVIAACVPGERHELGMRMLSGVLQEQGVVVFDLGPSVDSEFLIERVRERQPDAILLSATTSGSFTALRATIERLHAAKLPFALPPIFAGGQDVERRVAETEQLGAHSSQGMNLRATVEWILGQL